MQSLHKLWLVVRDAAADWQKDKAATLGAAVAFYCVLSLAPLLVIVVAITAAIFGEASAKSQLAAELRKLMGPDGAEATVALIEHAQQPTAGTAAAVLGIATLVFGESAVFAQLQDAMNIIWDVPPPKTTLVGILRARFLSFTMVLGTGFLLLISLVLSAWISSAGAWLQSRAGGWETAAQLASSLAAFAIVTALFAMIFELPDTSVAWRDVWVGATVTAALFTLGKYAIGLYLGTSGLKNAYGAAGSLVVLVVWTYYSAQIFFFGAELTQAWAKRFGSRSEK